MFNFTPEKGIKEPPRRICVYGPPGIGKTTFAAGADGVIMLDFEEGSKYLDVARNPDPIESYAHFNAWLEHLWGGEHDHKTVVIDTLDRLEALVWKHVCKQGDAKGEKSSIEDFGFGKGFNIATEEWRTVFNRFDMIRRRRGMEVILLAHAKMEKQPNPDGPEFQAWTLNLHKGAAAVAFQSCDIVMFAAQSMVVKKERAYGDEKHRAIGTGGRNLHTIGTPTYFAKNRCGLAPEIELTWEAFQKSYVAGKKPEAIADSIRAKLTLLSEAFKSSEAGAKLVSDVQAAITRAGSDTQKLIALTTWVDNRLQKIDEDAPKTQQQQSA